MINKILGFFKKFKVVQLSVFDKARNAVLGVESALAIFNGLMDELQVANNSLQAVADEAKAVIEAHSDLQEEAVASMYEYTNLMKKVQKLIGGTK